METPNSVQDLETSRDLRSAKEGKKVIEKSEGRGGAGIHGHETSGKSLRMLHLEEVGSKTQVRRQLLFDARPIV